MNTFSPIELFPNISCVRLKMTFAAAKYRLLLHGHLGSMWRGVVGHQLMEMCCPYTQADCAKCAENSYCLYSMLFNPIGSESGFSQPPPPWVIKIEHSNNSNQMDVYLTLIGVACDHAVTMVDAFCNAGAAGLGNRNVPATLVSVAQFDHGINKQWHTISVNQQDALFPRSSLSEILSNKNETPPWHISTTTPIRIKKREGCNIWSSAFLSLGQRLSLWQIFCEGTRLEKQDWLKCKQFFMQPHLQQDQLNRTKWHRYSQRQQKQVPVHGWSGRAVFYPPSHLQNIWWQWWQMAELFHLGKGTSMGLGAIHIQQP